jgi:pimeloyl-ACP methyl ester carboxylesterase
VADHAFDIGLTLAGMISTIHACRPDIHVNILAHSLGARVALRAVAALPKGHVHRLILLSGAEYRGLAQAAMATPCGRGLQALNVTSGENAVFDGIFRIAVPAAGWRDWPLSAGMTDAADWTDLRVDCPAALAALRAFGIRTRAPVTRVCHWSTYLRPGLFKLYRGVCDPGDPDLLARLAATLPSSPRYADRGRDLRLSPL